MLTCRDGKAAPYNTKSTGDLVTQSLWRGDVSGGLKIITPPMRLEGNKVTSQLNFWLMPALATGDVETWVKSWLKTSSKDIRLDVQDTRSDIYLVSMQDKGLLPTLRVTHH